MGWFQDNFPGSPAAKQRIFVSRMVIVYSVVVGASIYYFAPRFRRMRRDLEAGHEFHEPQFLKELRLGIKHREAFQKIPTREEFMQARNEEFKRDSQTFSSAGDLPEQEIRKIMARD